MFPPVRLSACNNSAPTERIFMKLEFFEKLSSVMKIWQKKVSLHEDPYKFVTTSRTILLELEIFHTELQRILKHTPYVVFFGNCAFYDIAWKNIVEPDRSQTTLWRMRIACWIPKAANTQNMESLLLFRSNNDYAKASECYVTGT